MIKRWRCQVRRTLFEKFVLVQIEAQRLMSDSDLLPNALIGRHFYDIYQLIDDSFVHELIDDREQVDVILDEISDITHQFFVRVMKRSSIAG